MKYRLIEAGEFMARRNGSVNPAKFPDEEFELHSIPAFDAGIPEFLRGSEIGSSKQIVQPNDVMISKIVPHIRRSSVVGPATGRRQIASSEWIVFRSQELFPHYLRHLLISDDFNAKFMSTVSGVGGSLLRARPAQVAKIKVPVPPLAEQRRVAEILDKADALRAKRCEAIAKLDQLLQSVFLDMFGDPVTNPKGWPTVRLDTVCSKVIDCPHSTPKWSDSGVVCLRTSNLGKGGWNWADTRYVTESEYAERSKRGEIEPGDVVLSREGTVGVLAVVEPGMRLCMGQRLVQLRANAEKATPYFLLHVLLHDLAPERISRLMAGSTSRHLNVKELRGLPVNLPPLSKQQQFSVIAEKIEQQKRILQRSANQLDSLFASLQNRAFSGTL